MNEEWECTESLESFLLRVQSTSDLFYECYSSMAYLWDHTEQEGPEVHRQRLAKSMRAESTTPSTGSARFTSMVDLLTSAKLFVQERVAAGDQLHPKHIFSLHLYTIDSHICYHCNCALRGDFRKQFLSREQVTVWSKECERWNNYIWHVQRALKDATPMKAVVFRGISLSPPAKNGLLDAHPYGKNIQVRTDRGVDLFLAR